MKTKINIKDRIVDVYDCDTGECEDELISFLDRKMKIRFHSAYFNNQKVVFIHGIQNSGDHSITITGYRKKQPGENISVSFG